MTMMIPEWQGPATDIPIPEYVWLTALGDNTYCYLETGWPDHDLPNGYDLYVVSMHAEVLDIDWVHKQCKHISSPIILLTDNNFYNWQYKENIFPFTYYSWHKQLDAMNNFFPITKQKNIKYKFSAHCNRLAQNKILIFTTLAKLAYNDSILKLSCWKGNDAELRTGNEILDEIIDDFYSRWYGQTIDLKADSAFENIQPLNANPWLATYQDAALHFTNESFSFSHLGKYIHPGPFITEKTLKCLLGATGFISVGQFDTYNSLSNVGFKFNYDIDISYDKDPKNIDRYKKIINLIHELSTWSKDDLYDATRTSSVYNRDYILQRGLYETCEKHNTEIKEEILNSF